MSLTSLAEYTFKSRYAKYNPEKERRENWQEVTDRVFKMHEIKFQKELENEEFKEAFKFAKQMVKERRVFGSQRALQYAIDPIFKNNGRLFNCTGSYLDRTSAFNEIFYMLLSGCGVGFSVQSHHIDKLPKIGRGSRNLIPSIKKYTIDDSIEGWADSIKELVNLYFEDGYNYEKYDSIDFDYSLIRPQGSHITGGFKAPGPEPLKKTIEIISEIFKTIQHEGGRKLKPIEAYDIVMHIADAVISGGVRRCWAKGSLVYTKNGLKPIENIVKGDAVITSDGTYKKVLNNFNQGLQDTLKVKTEDGEFFVTPNHKMAVYKNLYEYEWKEARNLTNNDLLVSLRKEIEGQKTYLPAFKYDKPLHSTTCKDIVIPELTEDIAWWLGELCGDGYIKVINTKEYTGGEVNCIFHINDMAQAEKFAEIYKEFGLEAGIIKVDKKQNCIKVVKKSKQLATYLASWLKLPNTEIRVHSCILEALTSIKLAFISGVMDADGSVKGNRGQHICSTIYHNFAKDLQNLMYSCGVSSRIYNHKRPKNDKLNHPNWKPIYKLCLLTKSSKEILLSCKQLFKKPYVNKCERLCESFPIEWKEQIRTKNIKSKITSNKITHRLLSEKDSNYNKNIAPVKIISLEKYKNIETYDIEVEDKHEFFCEGYLSHNSACIVLFDKDDEEMISAKSEPFWWKNNPQRMRSNNSAVLIRNEISKKEFNNIFQKTKAFGEPGFVFLNSKEVVLNPCSEISLVPMTYDNDGNHIASGFSCCNLTEIIGSKCKTEEDFYKACKAASIIGTMQAAYTDFKYLGAVTEEIAKRDALLGVSVTGWYDNSEILFSPEVQRKGAKMVKETNIKIAKLLNINPAKRLCTTKPSGTTSILAKTGSGIHPQHSRRYIRRVQSVNNEFCYNFFKMFNPHAIEENVIGSRDKRTAAILFPCEVPSGSIVKNQVTALEFLEQIKLTQNNWIKYGVNEEIGDKIDKDLTHNISNTVTVKPDEWEEVEDFIYKNRNSFCGISLLGMSGDLDYKQAPFTTIHTPAEIVKEYGDGSVMASGVICAAIEIYNGDLWDACNDVLYNKEIEFKEELENYDPKNDPLRYIELENKISWIKQAKRFADKYINGDYKRMTYLLKDVCNWKLWCDLKREWTEVPWDEALEDKEVAIDIDTMGAQACNGGACEINV